MKRKGRRSSSSVRYCSFAFDKWLLEQQVGIAPEELAEQLEQSKRDRRFLTTKEAAERGGFSADRLERWRWAGEGPPFIKLSGASVEFGEKNGVA